MRNKRNCLFQFDMKIDMMAEIDFTFEKQFYECQKRCGHWPRKKTKVRLKKIKNERTIQNTTFRHCD